jgi:oligopeptide transport system substrate-binding protein
MVGELATSANQTTLNRGIGGEPSTLDPALAVDTFSFEVLRDLFEGLTSEAPDGTIVPGTAETWTVDKTRKHYEFKIRANAKWSTGEKVTARDFVEAWRRVVNPSHASPLADILRPVRFANEIIAGKLPPEDLGVEAVNRDTLVVDLVEPTPYFPQLLTHSATFPVKSNSDVESPDTHRIASNGAFVLTRWVPGEEITIEKNRFYWDHSNVRLDTVVYKPIANEDTEFNLYRSGQLEITATIPVASLAFVRREMPAEIRIAPFLGVYYYAFNLREGPFRSLPKLRKALALAIDRDSLKHSLLPFEQQPAYGFVPPGTWNFTPQSWDWENTPADTRLAEARRLYVESGYSDSNPLHIRLLFNTNSSLKRIAIATAAMWSKYLGIQCELIDEEYKVFLDSRKLPNHWEVIRLGWTADFNDASNFLDTFRSKSANNDSGYDSSEFDRILDAASNTADENKRRKLLENAERIMLADYPIAPVYFYTSKKMIKPYVRGDGTNPLNRLYSKHLYLLKH